MKELVTTPPEKPARTPRRAKRRLPFAPSFMVGLLLVPISALAANFLITSTPVEAPVERYQSFQQLHWFENMASQNAVSIGMSEPTDTTAAEDLALACGPEGLALVEKEAAAVISDLERAALEALRPICEETGTPLPVAPEAPPIIQTVTVVQASAGTPAPAPPTTVDAQYEAFLAAYASAEAAINGAIAGNGDVAKINHAIDELAAAASSAQGGDYGQGINHAIEAERLANEALANPATSSDDEEDEEDEDHGTAEEFAAARADAQAAIDSAIARGGNQEKINEALEKLSKADRKAAGGDFKEAIEKADEAKKIANEA